MEPFCGDECIKVEEIEAFVLPGTPSAPVILLRLENEKEFYLYYVPYEVVEALNMLGGVDISIRRVVGRDRESIFDVLAMHEGLRDALVQNLEYVVIDELDEETGLFTAKAIFSDRRNVYLVRRMIPSHAVFLAVIARKPIYVKDELVEKQSSSLDLRA